MPRHLEGADEGEAMRPGAPVTFGRNEVENPNGLNGEPALLGLDANRK